MKCLNLIEGLDYLSNEVKLTINNNGNTRLKTPYGGFLSILSVIITVSFGLYFFIKLVNKDNTYLTISNEVSQFSNLSDSNNFPFLVRLTDKNNVPFEYPDKIYKISLKYWYGGSNSSLEMIGQKTVDINMEPCNLNVHFDKYRELFKDITDLDTFYCPRPRPYNETIYGIYGGIYPFGYYHFYVSMCYKKDHCKPLDEILKITENVYMDFRTIDFSINSLRKQAKTQIVLTERYMLSSTVYKRIWFYFSGVNYVTDTGLFFSTLDEDHFSKSESMRYDIDHRDIFTGTIPGTFVTLTVLNTGTVYIYNRTYLKIQEYIATVGGIVKFVQIIAFLLNYVFARNTYYVKLINDLHIFQKISKSDTGSDKIYSSVLKNNLTINNLEPKGDINESKANLHQFKSKFELNENLKKWYYRVMPFCVLPASQVRMIQKAIDLIKGNLNVVEILTKIEESHYFVKELIANDKAEKPLHYLAEAQCHCKRKSILQPVKNVYKKGNARTGKVNVSTQEEVNKNKKCND